MTCDIINNDFMSGNHNVTKNFQNPAGLRSITIFSFAGISKIFTNTVKVINLEINSKNAIIDMTSRRRTTSNQQWKNVVYVKANICNFEQPRTNVVYFNVNLNNIRQRQNNAVIFNVDFHKVAKRRNNVVNMTIWKKVKKSNFESKTK